MSSESVRLDVSYRQIVVHHRSLKAPFNDWSRGHVAQGFAWRPGSASFMTLNDGPHDVLIEQAEHAGELHPDAVRATEVPFALTADEGIQVASVADSFQVSLAPGQYSLRCEFLTPSPSQRDRVRLLFVNSDAQTFRILKADAELTPPMPLLTAADPA